VTPTELETGDAILKAAADLIGERGYKGTTTRAIAERAGVNEVTIFRRFGNKQGVLRALAEMWAGNMAGFAVSAVPDPEDTAGTLRTLAALEVRQARDFGAAALRLAFDVRSLPEVAEVLGGGTGQNLEGLADYLATRQTAGDLRADLDPHVMADGFFSLTSSFVMSRQVLGNGFADYDMPLDDVVAQLVDIYLTGISTKGAAS